MPGIRPRIGSGENAIYPITMRAEYQLPWNRQSSQTACGQNIQNNVGAESWRVVLEGIMSRPQLVRLNKFRDEEQVTVVTEEFGKMLVTFDQLNIERTSEEAVADFDFEDNNPGILLSFQLQTKEDSDDEEGIQFFNENTRGADYPGE